MHGNSFQRKLAIIKGGVTPTVDVSLFLIPCISSVLLVQSFLFLLHAGKVKLMVYLVVLTPFLPCIAAFINLI